MKKKVAFKKITADTLGIYNLFLKKEGSEYIATPVNIQALVNLSKEHSFNNILEMGSGIGTITYTLLKNSEAHIDAYEDNAFCQNALKDSLSEFQSRYTLLPEYTVLPPRSQYDLIIVDGGNGKPHDGGTVDAIDFVFNAVHDVSVVYVEGHRYIQRARLRNALSKNHLYYLVDFAPVVINGKKYKGGLAIFCTRSRNLLAKKLNHIYWSFMDGGSLKRSIIYRLKVAKLLKSRK